MARRKDSWSESEEQYVIEHCETMTDEEMAENLPGRTMGAVRSRRVKLGSRKYKRRYQPKIEVDLPDRSQTAFAYDRPAWFGWRGRPR